MNVKIIHHHLYPGGVSKVIDSQIRSLQKNKQNINCQLVLGGALERCCGDFDVLSCPELNYLPADISAQDCQQYYSIIKGFLTKNLKKDDILHFHNLNFGKNPVLTYVVYELASDGYRILNHCHDFAEDSRPEQLEFMKMVVEHYFGTPLRKVLYPTFNNYQFAVLNNRDQTFLKEQRVEASRINFLPNPIFFQNLKDSDPKLEADARERVCSTLGIDKESPIFLYPVRVIKRKNIGELILFATVFRKRASWLVTLDPNNPREHVEYLKWKFFCQELEIPVYFDVGSRLPIEDLMAASDKVVTTSIHEGFGMAFLEPWLFSTPVVGRDLSYLTNDFKENHIEFPCLYDNIPIKWKGHSMDFPRLSFEEQQHYIIENYAAKVDDHITGSGRMASDIFFTPSNKEIIESNRQNIMNNYSLKSYGKKLIQIYENLSAVN